MRGQAKGRELVGMATARGGRQESSSPKSQQPGAMGALEWLRVREGLREGSGTALYGIKEALGRAKRSSWLASSQDTG